MNMRVTYVGQENSLVERLKREKEVLSGTVNFLAAKSALMGALDPPKEEGEAGESGAAVPPPGGPD